MGLARAWRIGWRSRPRDVLVVFGCAAFASGALREIIEGATTSDIGELSVGAGMLAGLLLVVMALRREVRRRGAADEALWQAQTRLRDMVDASSDWLWEMGPDLRFTRVTGNVIGLSEAETAAFLGKTRLEISDTSLDPDAWARHADDLEHHRPFRDFVFAHRMSDGRLRWRKVSGKPFFDRSGRFCGYRGTGSDVTVQKEAELALEAAIERQHEIDARFKSLVLNLPGIVYRCLIDKEWTEVYISDFVEEVVGYPASDFIGNSVRSFASITHPDDRLLVEQATAEAIEARSYFTVQYRLIHRDGTIRWVYEKGQIVFGADDRPQFIDGIIFDITERKAADMALAAALNELRNSEEKFRSLVSNVPGVVFRSLIDKDWTELFVSDGIEQLTGYPATDFIENKVRTCASVIHPEDRMISEEAALRAIEKRAPFAVEYRVLHRDGSVRWVYEKTRPIFDEEGHPKYLDGVIFDISERKAAEAELARTKIAAECASRAKSEFLAMMSHELRTPLNAIIGFSQMLVQEVWGPVGNERYSQYARDINQSGGHLLELINDILDISRAEAGRLELWESDIDVGVAIENSLAMIRPRAAQAGVELVSDVATDLPPLRADERRFRQIMLNLLSNAVKFTPKGGRVVVFGDASASGLRIVVEDTGIGIAAADMPKALSLFGQIDSALNRAQPGSGIGLPLTRHLIEAHGASFDLKSTVGGGTTVTINFPAYRLLERAA
jgi:PAS domain S-box-containing protein